MYYQRSLEVEIENISYHRRSLTMNYQQSLKIAKRYQTPMFTADVLPTFTEGRRRKYIISPLFTDDDLSMFTDDRKKITNTDFHYRCTTNVH